MIKDRKLHFNNRKSSQKHSTRTWQLKENVRSKLKTKTIVVITGKIGFLLVLGRPSFGELGMLKTHGSVNEPNKEVRKFQNKNPELKKILHRHKPEKKTGTKIYFKKIARQEQTAKVNKFTCL